jgi:hypothetical protein
MCVPSFPSASAAARALHARCSARWWALLLRERCGLTLRDDDDIGGNDFNTPAHRRPGIHSKHDQITTAQLQYVCSFAPSPANVHARVSAQR